MDKYMDVSGSHVPSDAVRFPSPAENVSLYVAPIPVADIRPAVPYGHYRTQDAEDMPDGDPSEVYEFDFLLETVAWMTSIATAELVGITGDQGRTLHLYEQLGLSMFRGEGPRVVLGHLADLMEHLQSLDPEHSEKDQPNLDVPASAAALLIVSCRSLLASMDMIMRRLRAQQATDAGN